MALSFDLSSLNFPERVTGIKLFDGEWFKGGYNYQTQHNGWTSRIIIPTFKSILWADHYITPSAGNVLETDYIPVIKLANGYTYKVKFRAFVNGNNYNYSFAGNLFDLNGDGVGNEAISGTSCYVNINTGLATPMGTLYQDIVSEFILYTRYYPEIDPSEAVHPNQLVLGMAFGSLSNGFTTKAADIFFNEWVGNNAGEYEPLRFLQIGNLGNFNTYIKSHGDPVSGDIFTDEPLPDDPAGSDDTSKPGGGGGNYDDTSDPVDFPALPQGGALECGAVVAHRVSNQTLLAIVDKLWDDGLFDIGNMWQKAIQDPMDAIVSLHALPVSPTVDGQTPIWIGNYDTELSSPEITSQYVAVDCGSINIKEFWGSALDYSPYTKFEIYLPFIGVKELRIEDVMNNTIQVKYHVDCFTGDCVAFIKCGISVLYHYTGNCKMPIPLRSTSSDLIGRLLMFAGSVATGVGIAAGGGLTVGATASGMGAGLNGAANVVSTKINVSRSGALDGNAGLLDDFIPYVIIHRPVQSLARDYNKFKGYPSNITSVLGNLSGYTEVEHIHLKGIPNATSEEMEEIVSLLKQGIII